MGRMKQLLLDIIESREEADSDDTYAFPNHPIVPTKPAVFDDRDFLKSFGKPVDKLNW